MSKLSEWVAANKDDPDNELNVRNYILNTEYYEREFAKAEAEGQVYDCSQCGYPRVIDGREDEAVMIEQKLCFTCWFWLIYQGLANGPRPGAVIVSGNHYRDGGNRPNEKTAFLGFGGSKWAYRKIGETEWTETNNMWHQGVIPKRLNIPDSHEFRPFLDRLGAISKPEEGPV